MAFSEIQAPAGVGKPLRRQKLWKRRILRAFTAILLVYNGYQIINSAHGTIEGLSSFVQLTYNDANENERANTQHPYYTICPILDQTANLNNPNATLQSVMQENSFDHPPVNYMSHFEHTM